MTADWRPWPTVEDTAAALLLPAGSLSTAELAQLQRVTDSAIDQARVIPEWRTAEEIPMRVWDAVVGLAALTYRAGNAAGGVDTVTGDAGTVASARWRYLLQIGYGRGGRPRVG